MKKIETIWPHPAAAWAMWMEAWTAWGTTFMWWIPQPLFWPRPDRATMGQAGASTHPLKPPAILITGEAAPLPHANGTSCPALHEKNGHSHTCSIVADEKHELTINGHADVSGYCNGALKRPGDWD
ncbi:MAG: hypothetical protein ACLPPF_15530 [Rhodomicrobium sp.]